MLEFDQKNDIALLLVFGQSNAHGHGTRMEPGQRILKGLPNVHGLARQANQAYDLTDVSWSNFLSQGMNLGETQDHTCCLANHFARLWQQHIDRGNRLGLPDLYVIQISIGGQGIAEREDYGNMWYPDRPKVLVGGSLGQVDISLYPLAVQIIAKSRQNLIRQGKKLRVLGLHWNQWETEVDTGGAAILDARQNYTDLFAGFRQALPEDFTIYLYQLLSRAFNDLSGIRVIEKIFTDFVAKEEGYAMIDIRQADFYDPDQPDQGIFLADLVHYSCTAQSWFAEHFFYKLLGSRE